MISCSTVSRWIGDVFLDRVGGELFGFVDFALVRSCLADPVERRNDHQVIRLVPNQAAEKLSDFVPSRPVLQELARGDERIVHHFRRGRGLVRADVNRDGGGLAIARAAGVAEEREYFAELRVARKLFFPRLAIGDDLVIKRGGIFADGEPVIGVGQKAAARMFRDIILELIRRILVFPGEECAECNAVFHILGARAFRKFTQIFFVGRDRIVIAASHEFGVA